MKRNYAKEFQDLIELEPNYELISEYIKNNKYVQMKHLTCRTTYPVKPEIWKFGSRCPECFGNNKVKSKLKFEQLLEKEENYKLKSEYVGTDKYVQILHKTCGTTYPVTPHSWKQGRRCPKCAREKTAFEIYKDKPTWLYYIEINGIQQKIGLIKVIYNRNLEDSVYKSRYNKNEGNYITIIKGKLYKDGWIAYQREQKIISLLTSINKREMILESGHTETFNLKENK